MKKILCLAMIFILVFSVSACNNSASDEITPPEGWENKTLKEMNYFIKDSWKEEPLDTDGLEGYTYYFNDLSLLQATSVKASEIDLNEEGIQIYADNYKENYNNVIDGEIEEFSNESISGFVFTFTGDAQDSTYDANVYVVIHNDRSYTFSFFVNVEDSNSYEKDLGIFLDSISPVQ